jgi:uncharacterized membrane protein YgcG
MRRLAVLPSVAFLALVVAGLASAASPPPAGPPYPDPVDGQAVYDYGNVIGTEAEETAERIIDAIEAQTRAEVVLYTQNTGRDTVTTDEAEQDAQALMDQWGVGRRGIDDGLVILYDLDSSGQHGQVQLFAGPGFASSYLSNDARQEIFDDAMQPALAAGDFDGATLAGLARIAQGTLAPTQPVDPGTGKPAAENAPPPGPPFPAAETDRAVYDFAGLFSPDAIVNAESVIDGIEARTGAEVVVFSQPLGSTSSEDETEARARALMDQWHVGRQGFDDGLVIFFDIDSSGRHGQVQLYAGPGFEAAFLSNSERQSIYENDMLPFLRSGDFDGALGAALAKVDAAATPEHAAELERGRQLNAVLGLIGAPVILLGLVGWAMFHWRRFGKDPVYLDDPSIHVPAPPADLTAASGAMVMDGSTSRRALTTAMLDLASRGLISFQEDGGGILGTSKKVGIHVDPPLGDQVEEARRALNARRPIGPAEEVALHKLRTLGGNGSGDFISSEDLPKFGTSVAEFDKALEKHVVARGWFDEAPSKAISRWSGRGALAIIGGVIALVFGFSVPISGLTLIGGAAVLAGILVLIIAQAMPAVTLNGAMIRAMLAAYRRTLEKTMEQARSMQQVVDEAGLDWLETPDQAVVWGTALGLQGRIEDVLQRSLEDVKQDGANASAVWFPAWYHSSSGAGFANAAGVTGSGGSIFSGSGIPDIGGMMGALGTIGNSPSSSGSSGGGGFSGGGSGGGGGGAGGGF